MDLRTVEYLAIGDFNFSTDRAVMLPGPSSEAEAEGDHADGVALIAGLLAHLRQVEGQPGSRPQDTPTRPGGLLTTSSCRSSGR